MTSFKLSSTGTTDWRECVPTAKQARSRAYLAMTRSPPSFAKVQARVPKAVILGYKKSLRNTTALSALSSQKLTEKLFFSAFLSETRISKIQALLTVSNART